MMRCGALLIAGLVVACAGGREVSKLRYTSTDCPDPSGCGAPLGDPQYHSPDDAHDRAAQAESPAPSCTTVAVALTALEVGNYASEDDERLAIQDKHAKACEAARLDARELACLSTVTDVKHVGYCTRKLGAPTQRITVLTRDECRTSVDVVEHTLQSYGQGATAPAYRASCIEDGWPRGLEECFVERGSYDMLNACRTEAPGWLLDQIQARIDKLTAAK